MGLRGTMGRILRAVMRPKLPNRCSIATILLCTFAGMPWAAVAGYPEVQLDALEGLET